MLPSSLREKLSQVQEELASSFRTLVLADPSPIVIPSRSGKHFDGIRLDAGADLLNHYQFQWCRMREASDINYQLAERADKAIVAVELFVNQQHSLVSTLTTSLTNVSSVIHQLKKISDSIEITKKLLSETEKQLQQLEDLVEDDHLNHEIKEYEKKLTVLQDNKFAELNELKDQLAAEYEQKAKEHEVKQFIKAKERQAIFEEAFETEIQQYKESGVIPRLHFSERPTASLEEIVVDDDPSSLNEFLDE